LGFQAREKPFPKFQPPVKPPSAPFVPTKPIVLLNKKQLRAKLGISEVTLWTRIRTGRIPEGLVMGPDNGPLSWIEEQIDGIIVNAPRRRPKSSSTVTP
jgi:predicted DNA-binding transcriptional regulator AlpA